MNIKKIVILGGGSAGWLSAANFLRYFPSKSVTLVESATVPTIGVGESTTAMMKYFINGNLKIKDQDFLPGVDGFYKMSVKFEDFYKLNDGGFHYPLASPFVDGIGELGIQAWDLVKYFFKILDRNDFVESYYPSYHLLKDHKFNKNLHNQFDNFDPDLHLGYHFDANKLGAWLRDHYCLEKGLHHIIGDFAYAETNDNGIRCLKLTDGREVSGDLFVDCSGFRSLLLSGIMKPSYTDVSYKLPNNRAWATPIKYKDRYAEMLPYTNCTALKNGWAWYTPIASRIGNGYSYSDKYIDADDALNEFKNYLKCGKLPVKLSKNEIENLPYFQLTMKAGYYNENMIKNVVGIGLSAGFLEPLEGTGLLFVTDALLSLNKILYRESLNQFSIDTFNLYMKEFYETWIDTLCSFYFQTIRDDSEYWKEIKNKQFDKNILDNNNSVDYYSIKKYAQRLIIPWSNSFHDAFGCVSRGCELNFNINESTFDSIRLLNKNHDYEKIALDLKYIFDARKNQWKQSAAHSQHILDYLRENQLINF